MIIFTFEGVVYTVDIEAQKFNRIVLPNRVLLQVSGWKNTNPPEPLNLYPIGGCIPFFPLKTYANLVKAALASEKK